MIGSQEQLSGVLTIIELTKIYGLLRGNLFILKEVSLKEFLKDSFADDTK